MRTLGLFNMAYGTTGFVTAERLDLAHGMAVSIWVMALGGLGFLGHAPNRAMAARLIRRLR